MNQWTIWKKKKKKKKKCMNIKGMFSLHHHQLIQIHRCIKWYNIDNIICLHELERVHTVYIYHMHTHLQGWETNIKLIPDGR